MTAITDRSNFDLGRVPGGTFALVRANFLNFVSLAIVLVGIPTLATYALSFSVAADSGAPAIDPGAVIGRGLVAMTVGLVQIAGAFLLQATIVTGAISDLNGERIDVAAMITGRLSMIPILLGLAILQGLAEFIGFLLLIVPGLILATMWSVSVPAAVIEKTGVFGALSRSADLTRGHRWGIFGLILVYVIAASLLGAVLRGLFFGMGAMFPFGEAALAQQRGLGILCFNAALSALSAMIGAAGVAVIYYELRRAREGVAPRALVNTFS